MPKHSVPGKFIYLYRKVDIQSAWAISFMAPISVYVTGFLPVKSR